MCRVGGICRPRLKVLQGESRAATASCSRNSLAARERERGREREARPNRRTTASTQASRTGDWLDSRIWLRCGCVRQLLFPAREKLERRSSAPSPRIARPLPSCSVPTRFTRPMDKRKKCRRRQRCFGCWLLDDGKCRGRFTRPHGQEEMPAGANDIPGVVA